MSEAVAKLSEEVVCREEIDENGDLVEVCRTRDGRIVKKRKLVTV